MKKKEKGFSLLEILIALAIISIAILPIMSMYPNALKLSSKATNNEEWSRISVSIVDYIKSRGYNNIKTIMGGATTKEFVYSGSDSFTWSSGTYSSTKFETDFLGGTDSFFINTKGIRLSDYKFSVYLEDIQPEKNTAGVKLYSDYQLNGNSIVSNSTSASIIFGIVKIRKKVNDDDTTFDDTVFDGTEGNLDMKFVITPIENWGE